MPALGEEFRSAREARGLSLSDVAERLHIRSVYLGAIEDEDWDSIGAPVYVRGFMRTYARFLGLDAEAAVARFAAVVPSTDAESGAMPAAAGLAGPGRERSSDRRGPSVAAVVAILVALVLIVFVGYEFYQYRTEAAGVPVAEASAVPASPAPRPPAHPGAAVTAVAPVAAPALKPAAKRGLSVKLTQRSWLRVSVDGKLAVEGIFPAGTAKSFAGKSADVRVGNAGGVRIALNGRDLGPLGGDGDVVERQFALGGE